MKKLLLIAILVLLLMPNISFGAVLCEQCLVGTQKCACSIDNCDSGFVEVYTSSTCSGDPTAVYTFSGGFLNWSPKSARTYYLKAYCDDRTKTSGCDANVARTQATTTTTPTTTTRTTTTTTPSEGGFDLTLILLALLLVILIVVFVYIFVIKKKKPAKVSYEELYRKWRK